jgi:hypothetical protein
MNGQNGHNLVYLRSPARLLEQCEKDRDFAIRPSFKRAARTSRSLEADQKVSFTLCPFSLVTGNVLKLNMLVFLLRASIENGFKRDIHLITTVCGCQVYVTTGIQRLTA